MLYELCLWCYIQNSLLYPKSSRFSHVLSSRDFIALCFLKFMIHFWVNFMRSVRPVYSFIVLKCEYPVVLAPFGERTFSSLLCLCFFVKNQLSIFRGVYFWALYSVSLIYSFANTKLSLLLYICSKFWSQVASTLQLCSPSILCWLSGLLSFHINFKISLLISTK